MNGLKLNGFTDYIESSGRLFPEDYDVTIEFSIESGLFAPLWNEDTSTASSSKRHDFEVQSNGRLKFVYYQGGTGIVIDSNLTVDYVGINAARVVKEGQTLTIYLNGESETYALNNMKAASDISAATKMRIGNFRATFFSKMKVYRFEIVGVVEWNFSEGQGSIAYDSSGNGNHATIAGAAWLQKRVRQRPRKNLWDGTLEQGTLSTSTGLPSSSTSIMRCADFVSIEPLRTYMPSGYTSATFHTFFYDGSRNFISYTPTAFGQTFTTPFNARYMKFANSSLSANSEIQIELGSVATGYEPYEQVNDTRQARQKPRKNWIENELFISGGAWTVSGGSFQLSAANNQNTMAYPDTLTLPPGTYTISTNVTGLACGVVESATGTVLLSSALPMPQTFTLSKASNSFRLHFKKPDLSSWASGVTEAYDIEAQLELGSTATDFEPYELINDTRQVRKRSGKNLFNKNTITADYFVRPTLGSLLSSTSGNNASDYIPVEPSTTYTSNIKANGSSVAGYAFYDANKNVISGGVGNAPNAIGTITTPVNAAYIRITVADEYLNIGQFEIGSVSTGYEEYGQVQGARQVRQRAKKNMVPAFGEWTVIHEQASIIDDYTLVLNASAALKHSYYEAPVSPGNVYTFSAQHNGRIQGYCFNRSGAATQVGLLSSNQSFSFTAPADSVKVRVYCTSETAGTYTFTNPQLELGSVATDFEPYELVDDVKRI